MKKFLWTLPLVCFLPLLVGCGGSGGGGSGGGGGNTVVSEEEKFAALVKSTRAAAETVDFKLPTTEEIASFPISLSEEFKASAYWTNKNDKNYILSFRVSREYKGNQFVYDVLGLSEVYARNITGKYMSGASQGEPVKIGVWDSGITKSALNYKINKEKHHDTLKTRVTGVSVENMNENGDTMNKDVKLSDKDIHVAEA